MIRDSLLDQIKLENKLDDDLVEKFFKNRNIYDDQNKKIISQKISWMKKI